MISQDYFPSHSITPLSPKSKLLFEEIQRLKKKIPSSYDMIAKVLVLSRPIIDIIFMEMGFFNIDVRIHKRGRPPVSKISLLLIHFIAQIKGIISYRQVIREINNHLYWKTALQMKKIPHHSTLSKFRKSFSANEIHTIFIQLVQFLQEFNILNGDTSVIVDSAPIEGNQNFARSNGLFEVDKKRLAKLMKTIDLTPALKLIVPSKARRGRATKYPPKVLIRFFLYEKLCGFLSRNQAVSYLKKYPDVAVILGFPKESLPNKDYFSNLVRHLPPISLLLQQITSQVVNFFDLEPTYNENDPLHFFFWNIENRAATK